MLVGFIMAEEDMSKTWEKAEKMLAKGNATGCLDLLREADPSGKSGTTLRIAGEATWAIARKKDSKAEYRNCLLYTSPSPRDAS